MKPKVWNPPRITEDWQRDVVKNELQTLNALVQNLSYYLTNAGIDVEKGLADISEMSGIDIVKALKTLIRTRKEAL